MRRPRNNHDAYWDMFDALLDSTEVFLHAQVGPQVGNYAHLGVAQGLGTAVDVAVEAAVSHAKNHPALRDYFRQVIAAPNRRV